MAMCCRRLRSGWCGNSALITLACSSIWRSLSTKSTLSSVMRARLRASGMNESQGSPALAVTDRTEALGTALAPRSVHGKEVADGRQGTQAGLAGGRRRQLHRYRGLQQAHGKVRRLGQGGRSGPERGAEVRGRKARHAEGRAHRQAAREGRGSRATEEVGYFLRLPQS